MRFPRVGGPKHHMKVPYIQNMHFVIWRLRSLVLLLAMQKGDVEIFSVVSNRG